jgi:hypothetical protein
MKALFRELVVVLVAEIVVGFVGLVDELEGWLRRHLGRRQSR